MGPLSTPTLRAHKIIQHDLTSIRSRLETVRSEAVTGRVSDVARAVNGDTAKVNRLTGNLAYAEERITVLGFEGDRAAGMQTTLTSIREGLATAGNAASLALGSPAANTLGVAATEGMSAFRNAAAWLNTDFGGRPMFGGDSGLSPLVSADEMLTALRGIVTAAPDTATAIADIDAWFSDPAGGFATTAFEGGSGDAPDVELNKSERISTSVRADDTALRDTLLGFALTALSGEATGEADKRAFLEAGNSKMGTALNSTVELQASLGVKEEQIASAQSTYQAQVASLSIALNGITGRDQAEAATEMRLLESQLEAAYLTTSRLSNLSLTNYLR